MTRQELSSSAANIATTNAEASSESERLDKQEIIQKYTELNDACDKILARIKKGSKKQSKNRSK